MGRWTRGSLLGAPLANWSLGAVRMCKGTAVPPESKGTRPQALILRSAEDENLGLTWVRRQRGNREALKTGSTPWLGKWEPRMGFYFESIERVTAPGLQGGCPPAIMSEIWLS